MSGPLSRRTFLRGGATARPIQRPPWTDAAFTDACTACGDCISACPEQILFKGDGGMPEIRFDNEGCTFCGDCAAVCEQPVFERGRRAFPWRASLGSDCLALHGVDCQSCRDVCEPQAIRFHPALGKAPQPQLSLDACTGCGACISVCPANAITLESPLHGQ